MNLEGLRQKLVRAARRSPPSDSVPYAFERRIMHAISRLPGSPADMRDTALPWIAGLWRAALCAVAIAAVTGGIHWQASRRPASDSDPIPDADLLEVAVLAELPGYDEPAPDYTAPTP